MFSAIATMTDGVEIGRSEKHSHENEIFLRKLNFLRCKDHNFLCIGRSSIQSNSDQQSDS